MVTSATRGNWGDPGVRTTGGRSVPVEIVGIDGDRLEKDATFQNAYAFYIKLSGHPDQFWQAELAKWDSALSSMQRSLSVESDRLRVVFVYGDNVQACTDYAARLVNWTNERVAEHNKSVASAQQAHLQRRQIELTREESILQELKSVRTEPSVSPSEMTVDKLIAAFENDTAEYDRYRNTSMRLRGFVNRIERNYVLLANKYKSPKSVVCVFDKGHVHELKRLRTGQMVAVTGQFEGSVLQASMRNCRMLS